MVAQRKIKKSSLFLIVVASMLIAGGLSIFTGSERGKEIYADVWLEILTPVILLSSSIGLMVTTWNAATKQRKLLLAGITGFTVLVLINSLSHDWQLLPWGRASALETINAFMTDLHNAEADSAVTKLSPVAQKHVMSNDFHFPFAQPISWQLGNINRNRSITGYATFADGAVLPIEFRLTWIWNEWKIYGVKFGEAENILSTDPEVMPRVYFMYCCDNSGIFDGVFALIFGREEFGYNFSR